MPDSQPQPSSASKRASSPQASPEAQRPAMSPAMFDATPGDTTRMADLKRMQDSTMHAKARFSFKLYKK